MSQDTKNEQFENKALQLQVDLLHKSNEITDQAVGRLDDIISKLRNWAVVIWTGSSHIPRKVRIKVRQI